MSLAMWLYAVDVLCNFSIAMGVTFAVFAVGLFIFILVTFFHYDIDKKVFDNCISVWKRMAKKSWIAVLWLLVMVALPSQKTMYLMLGTAYLSQTNLPANVQKALELKLDDVIADLQTEHKGHKK
jgi:hypothetical protein